MTIMIIDDGIGKCRKIEAECGKRGIETKVFHDLESAQNCLKNNHSHIDGIITDMRYPLQKGGKAERAGNQLLDWLLKQKIEIPVLGNSHLEFNSEYPYFKEKMNGYFEEHIFQKFVSLIGGHN